MFKIDIYLHVLSSGLTPSGLKVKQFTYCNVFESALFFMTCINEAGFNLFCPFNFFLHGYLLISVF